MFKKISSFLEKLSPHPSTGGLAITSSSLCFLKIEGEKLVHRTLRLPPGVIAEGKIIDQKNFISILQNFRSRIDSNKKKNQIIVSLPAESVCSQSFNIPRISSQAFGEAIALNLQMLSPFDIEKVYTDWQILNENSNYYEILGVFVERALVDEYNYCLRESGFLPVAFEFPAFSLTRVLKELGPPMDSAKPYLAIEISGEGLDFFIIKNNELYFNHFFLWRSILGNKKEILFSNFRNILVQEVRKIINFCIVDFKKSFEEVLLITQALEKEMAAIIQTEFGLGIIPLRLKKHTAAPLPVCYFVSLGAACRGLIPRFKDKLINLTNISVIEEFYREQILAFISNWRNVFVVFLMVFLIAFGGIDVFFAKMEKDIRNQISSLAMGDQSAETEKLQQEANEFNQKLALISQLRQSSRKWSPFFEQINRLTKDNKINLNKFFIQSKDLPVRFGGQADSENDVFNFVNKLEAQENIEKVDLPLTNITHIEDKVNFDLNFNLVFHKD